MSKRLQVVLGEAEWEQLQQAARSEGLTLSAWVRRVLHEARNRQPGGDLNAKIAAVRAAARHRFPTADVEQMLDEVAQGYQPQTG